ncbi:MAG: universal stress protein [Alphaproteobacteria bacterium]|nr:universal stress protein [Alphaproteobacteria bacterium]
MGLNYVLCPVTGGEEDGPALRAALGIALGFNAHVRALFVRSSVVAAIPYLGEGLTGTVVENIIAAANKASDESFIEAKRHIDQAVAACKATEASLSVRVQEGIVEDEVAAASRLADLVVYARDPGDAAFPDRSLAEHTLLGARRPILIAPPRPPDTIGAKIAVLWDGGTPAAAAVLAALPFIRKAQSVEIVHLAHDEESPHVVDDLRDALAIRGLDAAMRVVDHKASVDGAHVLSAAMAAEPDLIVMGGYSHSRLRQLVLGGVTRHMLKHAPVHVLMAH